MIAFAGALRLETMRSKSTAQQAKIKTSGAYAFSVKPRWDLAELQKPYLAKIKITKSGKAWAKKFDAHMLYYVRRNFLVRNIA